MGYLSYCMNLFLYIMSSCLRRYSVFNLILQMHAGQRSMSGVIVVDAESFDLLVTDVMPIYMIMPRYSHNYAQFYQLLNSNLFTHRRILMLSREATSETYGPRVYLHHINLPILSYLLCLYFTLHLYHKNTKNIIYHLYQISLS